MRAASPLRMGRLLPRALAHPSMEPMVVGQLDHDTFRVLLLLPPLRLRVKVPKDEKVKDDGRGKRARKTVVMRRRWIWDQADHRLLPLLHLVNHRRQLLLLFR